MPAIASGGIVKTYGATAGASSAATAIASNASANTKGTAVELTAATEFDAHWLSVALTNMTGSAGNAFLVDILGGAATETVVVPDLFAVSRGAGASFGPYLFPVYVPKGTRLAARCQSSIGASSIDVAVTLIGGGAVQPGSPPPPGIVSAYGATASSQGTNIDPRAVADTDSSWTQVAAATDRDHNWLVLSGGFGDGQINVAVNWRLSLGIGAATEQALIPDLHISGDTGSDRPFNPVICLPCFIPKGSRLTAKVRSSVTTDGDRDVHLKIYGCG